MTSFPAAVAAVVEDRHDGSMFPSGKKKCSGVGVEFQSASVKLNDFTIVGDGMQKAMQVQHTTKATIYPKLSADTRHYYTEGCLPAFLIKGTPRSGRYGQLVVDLELALETVIRVFIKTSPALRSAIGSDKVVYIRTNFFPINLRCEEDDSKTGTSIYLRRTKSTPSFSKTNRQEPHNVYVYPSKIARMKEDQSITCTLGVTSSLSPPDNVTIRPFDARVDKTEVVSDGEATHLTEVFLRKWRKNSQEEVVESDEDDEIFRGVQS